MKRKIEITATERIRIFGTSGEMFCSDCQKFAEFFTIAEAAGAARVTTTAVRRWVAAGKIHGARTMGGQYRLCGNSLFPELGRM